MERNQDLNTGHRTSEPVCLTVCYALHKNSLQFPLPTRYIFTVRARSRVDQNNFWTSLEMNMQYVFFHWLIVNFILKKPSVLSRVLANGEKEDPSVVQILSSWGISSYHRDVAERGVRKRGTLVRANKDFHLHSRE